MECLQRKSISLMDSIFATYASLEGPAYLWYAIRIQQLPIALFGIALASALLPLLQDLLLKKIGAHFKGFFVILLPKVFILFFLASLQYLF